MVIVKINNAPRDRRGQPVEFFDYFLRGTVWTARERAQEFATVDAAKTALERARKFMPAYALKKVEIVSLTA